MERDERADRERVPVTDRVEVTEPVIDAFVLMEAEPVAFRVVDPEPDNLGELDILLVIDDEEVDRYVNEGPIVIESDLVDRLDNVSVGHSEYV